jgi:hypothetical protein
MKTRIAAFFQDAWWLIEDRLWWVKAKLTGRCHLCGLKGGVHKFSCDGRTWGDPDGW